VQQRWYEKLHDWDNALDAYQEKHALHPDDQEILLGRMGRMRCLEALGKW